MPKFFSPLRYPGGKAKLAPYLNEIIKTHKNAKNVTFVEPFAGGAGAALTLLLTGQVKKIIINDLDPAIFSLWKLIVKDTDLLIDRIITTDVTIKEWKKQQLIYKSKTTDYKKLGFATFFLNRTNRSGIIEGGPIGGFEQNGPWKLNARYNKDGLIKRLAEIKKFRDYISVTNLDGISLLKRIQKLKTFENYFIFLDPPYIQKGQLLYLNHYKNANHVKLSNFINHCSLNWVMTYDDTPLVHELYNLNVITKFDISHTAHTRKIGKEVFIAPRKVGGTINIS